MHANFLNFVLGNWLIWNERATLIQTLIEVNDGLVTHLLK